MIVACRNKTVRLTTPDDSTLTGGNKNSKITPNNLTRCTYTRAQNTHTPEVIAMKLEEARLQTLPQVVERMMKPAEKIESIRINQMTGFGGASGGVGDGGDKSTINQVVDSVLSMALQLPAVQKLGDEVGMNIGDGVRGISNSLKGNFTGAIPDTPSNDASSDTKG